MKKTVCAILIITLLATLSGCGSKTQAPVASAPKPTDPTKPLIAGNDVFDGKHFDQMLWGYYEAATYDYTDDSVKDTAAFRKDMAYVDVSSKYGQLQLSVLPVDIQMGSYSQFMSTFFYEDKYYSAYTETGRAMFRKVYMEKFGDLSEEGFQKLEKLLKMNVAQMTFVQPDGKTQLCNLVYEIRDDVLTFYNLSVDESYNATACDVYARYHFLHDGGKLILDCNGIRREYLANGYKENDKDSLYVAGFAQDQSEQYENLEGFVLYGQEEGFRIEVMLTNDVRAVDPAVTFDKTTGDFSVTWTKSAYYSGQIQHKNPRVISGKLIPCTAYGFNGFSGFHLIIDGTCYSYLVSEEEYKARRYANVENENLISDLQREKLAGIKIGMLSEMEQACENGEVPVSFDFGRGQITLEADRLFGTDSQEITREGQEYLQRFIDVFTSVVLKEEYAKYISRIVIEGHTGIKGSYSENRTLSANRADAVAKCCANQNVDLGKEIQFTGCAYDYPIFDDDGSVNADESNRIVFRFLLADKVNISPSVS